MLYFVHGISWYGRANRLARSLQLFMTGVPVQVATVEKAADDLKQPEDQHGAADKT